MQGVSKNTVKLVWGISLALLAGSLSGCKPRNRVVGGGAISTFLAIADTQNNRVVLQSTPVSTNQSAEAVLGQPDNTSNAPNTGGLSASTMSAPSAVARGANQELFVSDTINCRVLIFVPSFSTGMDASAVLGQASETTANCPSQDAVTAAGLVAPAGAAADSQGNLWVADAGSHRVLKYTAPFSTGTAASVALGQTTTDSNTGTYGCNQASGGASLPPTAGTLCSPIRVAFDSSGNLWVTDLGNNRVLMFPPAQQIQGGVATLVLGQADFVSNSSGLSATKFDDPADMAFDSLGNLWVSDFQNQRVLKFMSPFSSGMAAAAVLGQTDFVSNGTGTSASTLWNPVGLAFDSSDALAVTDSGNHRTLIFPAAGQVTGGSATMVLGQPDLDSGAPNQGVSTGAETEFGPLGVSTFD